jgi:hypothetical protein
LELKRRIRWRIVGAAAGLAVVLPLASDTGRSSPPVEPHPNGAAERRPEDAMVSAALQVAIDPVTRQRILPSPEQRSALSAQLQDALSRSGDGLTVIQRPDGTKYLDLRGQFRCGLAAGTVAGERRATCVVSPQTLEAARHRVEQPAHREVQ